MAGSIEGNAALYKKKAFTYVPPSPPADLIETTSYTLDFANRKFVHIGIDPSEIYQVVVNILTCSRHVKISPNFLRRIFSTMGHILSYILDVPQKYKCTKFLETEFYKIHSMMYCGENVLVIESKTEDGCRVLLNRADLIRLQYLECCIFESIVKKTIYTARLVIEKTDKFAAYLREICDLLKSPPKNSEEMIIFVKNAKDERMDKSSPNLTGQIQMFAAKQLAATLLNRATHEDVEIDSPMSPSITNIFGMDEDTITYATLRPSDPLDDKPMSNEIDFPQPCDENDGPDCFRHFGALSPNQLIVTLPSLQPTFTEHPTPLRNVRRRLF